MQTEVWGYEKHIQASERGSMVGARAELPGLHGYVLYLWDRKKWILTSTVLAFCLGVLYAVLAKPAWQARATIAPKEGTGGSTQSFLSGLGGAGSLVASQLAMGQSGIERLEVMLKSRDMAERVIKVHDLMPRLFPDAWDAGRKDWKADLSESERPTLKQGVDMLNGSISVNTNLKSRLLYLSVTLPDPKLAMDGVNYFLEALNARIKEFVAKDAESNMAYLTSQLATSSDPLIQEKINQLVAMEIEKSMLMSTRSFDILDPPYKPHERFKPQRKKIVILYTALGLFLSILFLIFLKGIKDSMRVKEEGPDNALSLRH
jgi:uncharacterized protein involved in exopolysaccharide biosynthesis